VAKLGWVNPSNFDESIGFQASVNLYENNDAFGFNHIRTNDQYYYFNGIYQNSLWTPEHMIRTGASLQGEVVDESFTQFFGYIRGSLLLGERHYDYTNWAPGTFLEYSLLLDRFTLVAGIRGDYLSVYDTVLFTPRLHMRYTLAERTTLKASAGRGFRTTRPFSDNLGLLVSSRLWLLPADDSEERPYGLAPEASWNMGINFTQTFELDYREGSIQVDGYYTTFENRVLIDRDQRPGEIYVYNRQNGSYSYAAQVEVNYELIKRLEVRLAYRWVDARSRFLTGWLRDPQVPEHRGFIHLAYATRKSIRSAYWSVSATTQWVGEQRLPQTASNPEVYQRADYSDTYALLNLHVKRHFSDRLNVFIGVENALNFQQPDAILAADDPYGSFFDASLVWGPVFGRMVYGGLNYTLKKPEN